MYGSDSCTTPASIIHRHAAAEMEVQGNPGFELAETHQTLGFKRIQHFGFIPKPIWHDLCSCLAEPGRIQVHLVGYFFSFFFGSSPGTLQTFLIQQRKRSLLNEFLHLKTAFIFLPSSLIF